MTEPIFGEFYVVHADILATNCVLIVRDNAVVIVDAGAGSAQPIMDLVASHGWNPQAVLITHGHVDHTWDAAALSDEFDIPVLIHELDLPYLHDPFGIADSHSSPNRQDMLIELFTAYGLPPSRYRTPNRIEVLGDGHESLTQRRLEEIWQGRWTWLHAPGHTPGATIYLFDAPIQPLDSLHEPLARPLACTGDVLFAQGVGRTDLPGGDAAQMRTTLTKLVTGIDPKMLVLPGHGPWSTMAVERETNPYLPRH